MSGESDLIKLYSTRILALAADVPHTTPLETPQSTVKRRSPLCGSTVTVSLVVENGKISQFSQDVKACALGQAAAAVIGKDIIGASLEQVSQAREDLKGMLKSDGPTPQAPFDGLEVLRPARDYKNRHASILLSIEATEEAMKQALNA